MNGVHDMGGMHGFGPIDPEPEATEPVFHEPWEARALALTLACGFLGKWNIDQARFARESMAPAHYLRSSYYEKWIDALSRQLVEKGLVTPDELSSGRAAAKADPGAHRVLQAESVNSVMLKGGPVSVEMSTAPRFGIGDIVQARNLHPAGHTRLPRYVRGHVGEVVLHHGGHVFADASAAGDRRGEHLYTVRFSVRELWGEDAAAHDTVMVDLWEPYLEPA